MKWVAHTVTDWRPQHDRVATILEPPKQLAFDFAAQKEELNARKSSHASSVGAAGHSELIQAALPFLQLISASVTGCTASTESASALPFAEHVAVPSNALPPPAPQAELPHQKSLAAFLSYVEEQHGVPCASFQDAFVRDRVGPDVLGDMAISDLSAYGIPRGDVYRLKRAAQSWDRRESEEGTHSVKRARQNEVSLIIVSGFDSFDKPSTLHRLRLPKPMYQLSTLVLLTTHPHHRRVMSVPMLSGQVVLILGRRVISAGSKHFPVRKVAISFGLTCHRRHSHPMTHFWPLQGQSSYVLELANLLM